MSAPAPSGAATLDSKLVPSSGALWGIYAGPGRNGRTTAQEVPYLEKLMGRRFALDRWYYRWDHGFPMTREYDAVKAGRIPVIGWTAVTKSGTSIKWASIANGYQDAVINARADALKAFGTKVMVIFHHEPEDDHTNNGTAADYRAAWRRIVARFRARGATNVVFVWNLMAYTFNPNGKAPEDYYPGDDVIDWVAADGYNWFGSDHVPGQPWREFSSIFASFNSWAAAKGKPAMVAETGVLEDPEDPYRKSKWFANTASTMKNNWPNMKGFIYFQGHGWHFDSSSISTNGYKNFGADPWFSPMVGTTTSTTGDTAKPTVSITSPANGSNVAYKSTVRIAAGASDNVGVAKVEFYVNGSLRCTDTTATYNCDWTVWTKDGTSNKIKAVAYDAAGNSASQTIYVTTGSSDTTAPTVSITSPVDGSVVLRGSTVRIAANASDNTGVAKVEFWVNGSLKCTDTTASYTCDWKVWSNVGTSNWIKAIAYDAAGNQATHVIKTTTL